MRWEFTYLDLYLNRPENIRHLDARAAALGQDGWEPVGQVTPTYDNLPNHVSVPRLMFKRPIPDS